MKSGVDSDRRKFSAFWKPRHISNTLYGKRKSNRPYLRFGSFVLDALSSPKRPIHTQALVIIKSKAIEEYHLLYSYLSPCFSLQYR
jgi:hypothetical protein